MNGEITMGLERNLWEAGMRLEGENAGIPACINGLKLFELQNKG